MYSVFLSRYRNTHESLGELEKAVSGNYTRLQLMFPQHFSFSQTSTHVSIKQLDYGIEISNNLIVLV